MVTLPKLSEPIDPTTPLPVNTREWLLPSVTGVRLELVTTQAKYSNLALNSS